MFIPVSQLSTKILNTYTEKLAANKNQLKFLKLHGFGNEFILALKSTDNFLINSTEFIRRNYENKQIKLNNMSSSNRHLDKNIDGRFECFYMGRVNNETDDSLVYVNLCQKGYIVCAFVVLLLVFIAIILKRELSFEIKADFCVHVALWSFTSICLVNFLTLPNVS
jgi:hypothetical protein